MRAVDEARGRLGARAAVAVAVVVLAIFAFATALRSERGRRLLFNAVARASGYRIDARSLVVSPGLSARATGLTVAVPGEPPFFRADELFADVSPGSLFRRRVRLLEARGFEVRWDRLPRGGNSGRAPFEELRLVGGVVRGTLGAGARGSDVSIPRLVLARRAKGDAFAIRGALRVPARQASLHWRGTADGSGGGLAVRGRGQIGDFPGLLADLGAQAAAEFAGGAALNLRLRGDLEGALRARLLVTLGSPLLNEPARILARLALDENRKDATVRATARSGRVAPLRVRGTVDLAQAPWVLNLATAWRNADVAAVPDALRAPPQWLPRSGEVTLAGRIEGSMGDPAVELRAEASRLGARVAMIDVTADARASLRYQDGVLSSVDPHLAVEKLQMRHGATNAAAERLSVRADAQLRDDRLELALSDIAVASVAVQDEERALQAAAVELAGTLAIAIPALGPATGEVKLRAGAGELLYERAYLSLDEFPIEVFASITAGDEGVRFERSSLDVAKIGRVQGSASLNAELVLVRAQASASLPSITTGFEKLVRDTFADAVPFLGGTQLGGALQATLDYRTTSDGARAVGRIGVRNGSVAIDKPSVKLERYDLDVPFDLATGSAKGKSTTGSLKSGDLTVGGLAVAPIELPLVARTNEIEVTKPIAIPFGGGKLRADGLRAFDLASDSPAADVRIALEQMSIQALSHSLGLPEIQGNMAGDLGRFTLTKGRVTTTGALALDVFGGHVALSDITIEEIFSPVPSLHLDVEATDVDLRKATESLGVGYVSGVGRAKIEDLQISAGQPVRFDAQLETIPTAGVPQRVSVAAIQQLTILGGAGPDALTRSVLDLFDEYRYAKMGFRCSLRNDRFILHGIEEHDGKDFLVVGTLLPPTVNVISHNQVIAFSEMVKRLHRISGLSGNAPDVETHP